MPTRVVRSTLVSSTSTSKTAVGRCTAVGTGPDGVSASESHLASSFRATTLMPARSNHHVAVRSRPPAAKVADTVHWPSASREASHSTDDASTPRPVSRVAARCASVSGEPAWLVPRKRTAWAREATCSRSASTGPSKRAILSRSHPVRAETSSAEAPARIIA